MTADDRNLADKLGWMVRNTPEPYATDLAEAAVRLRALDAEVERLTARITKADDALQEIIDVRHGPFGPWDDDLCDYEQVAAIAHRALHPETEDGQ